MGAEALFLGRIAHKREATVPLPQIRGMRLAGETSKSAHNIRVECDTGCGHESAVVDLEKPQVDIAQVHGQSGVLRLRPLARGGSTPRSCDRQVPTVHGEL